MMSKTYIVNEKVIKILIESYLELLTLLDAGVDNWQWYCDAINKSEYWNNDLNRWDVDKFINENDIRELH